MSLLTAWDDSWATPKLRHVGGAPLLRETGNDSCRHGESLQGIPLISGSRDGRALLPGRPWERRRTITVSSIGTSEAQEDASCVGAIGDLEPAGLTRAPDGVDGWGPPRLAERGRCVSASSAGTCISIMGSLREHVLLLGSVGRGGPGDLRLAGERVRCITTSSAGTDVTLWNSATGVAKLAWDSPEKLGLAAPSRLRESGQKLASLAAILEGRGRKGSPTMGPKDPSGNQRLGVPKVGRTRLSALALEQTLEDSEGSSSLVRYLEQEEERYAFSTPSICFPWHSSAALRAQSNNSASNAVFSGPLVRGTVTDTPVANHLSPSASSKPPAPGVPPSPLPLPPAYALLGRAPLAPLMHLARPPATPSTAVRSPESSNGSPPLGGGHASRGPQGSPFSLPPSAMASTMPVLVLPALGKSESTESNSVHSLSSQQCSHGRATSHDSLAATSPSLSSSAASHSSGAVLLGVGMRSSPQYTSSDGSSSQDCGKTPAQRARSQGLTRQGGSGRGGPGTNKTCGREQRAEVRQAHAGTQRLAKLPETSGSGDPEVRAYRMQKGRRRRFKRTRGRGPGRGGGETPTPASLNTLCAGGALPWEGIDEQLYRRGGGRDGNSIGHHSAEASGAWSKMRRPVFLLTRLALWLPGKVAHGGNSTKEGTVGHGEQGPVVAEWAGGKGLITVAAEGEQRTVECEKQRKSARVRREEVQRFRTAKEGVPPAPTSSIISAGQVKQWVVASGDSNGAPVRHCCPSASPGEKLHLLATKASSVQVCTVPEWSTVFRGYRTPESRPSAYPSKPSSLARGESSPESQPISSPGECSWKSSSLSTPLAQSAMGSSPHQPLPYAPLSLGAGLGCHGLCQSPGVLRIGEADESSVLGFLGPRLRARAVVQGKRPRLLPKFGHWDAEGGEGHMLLSRRGSEKGPHPRRLLEGSPWQGPVRSPAAEPGGSLQCAVHLGADGLRRAQKQQGFGAARQAPVRSQGSCPAASSPHICESCAELDGGVSVQDAMLGTGEWYCGDARPMALGRAQSPAVTGAVSVNVTGRRKGSSAAGNRKGHSRGRRGARRGSGGSSGPLGRQLKSYDIVGRKSTVGRVVKAVLLRMRWHVKVGVFGGGRSRAQD